MSLIVTKDPADKIILDLCGGTGAWSRPYAEVGYDVQIVTLPQIDVVDFRDLIIEKHLPPQKVHGILAAPPCDHFSVSGAQYWAAKDADGRTAKALEVVDACRDLIDYLEPVWWSLENPIGRLKGLRARRFYDLSGTPEPRLKFDPGRPMNQRGLRRWQESTERYRIKLNEQKRPAIR